MSATWEKSDATLLTEKFKNFFITFSIMDDGL